MLTSSLNVDLKLMYVPSSDNTVDAPQGATLSGPWWELIEAEFGPHTVDMMALGSYATVQAVTVLPPGCVSRENRGI